MGNQGFFLESIEYFNEEVDEQKIVCEVVDVEEKPQTKTKKKKSKKGIPLAGEDTQKELCDEDPFSPDYEIKA